MNPIRNRSLSEPSDSIYYCRNCLKLFKLAQFHFDLRLIGEGFCSPLCKKVLLQKFEKAKSESKAMFDFITQVFLKRIRDFEET
jgi:hypothetical protein